MRPNKPRTTGEGDLFRARLDQIINMKHELVQLDAPIDWDWIDREVAPLYSDNGRPGIATHFVIGLLLLKHIYGLSDEAVCERWVYDPYFEHFTGKEFFQHEIPARATRGQQAIRGSVPGSQNSNCPGPTPNSRSSRRTACNGNHRPW